MQIKAVIRGELVSCIWHQRALRRANFFDQTHKARIIADTCAIRSLWLAEGVAFDVEFNVEGISQCKAIVSPNMSLVGSWVHRNTLRT